MDNEGKDERWSRGEIARVEVAGMKGWVIPRGGGITHTHTLHWLQNLLEVKCLVD